MVYADHTNPPDTFVACPQHKVATPLGIGHKVLQFSLLFCSSAMASKLQSFAVKVRYMKLMSKGQIAVIFALTSVALTGAISLGTDVGVLYYNWAQLQKAADSAALAGANYLPDNPSQATAAASQLARTNGLQSAEIISNTVSPDNLSITITTKRTVPYYFARVLGINYGYVAAAATATAQAPIRTVNATTPGSVPLGGTNNGNNGVTCSTTCSCGLIPIGLNSSTLYSDGSPITLQQGQVGPGNWDLLALGGVGGNNLRTNVANGYNGMITVGDWITTEPGKKVGPVDQGMQDRLTCAAASDPSGTSSSHAVTNARVMIMPVVDWQHQNGRNTVQVKAFATVWLDAYNNGAITVHFISQVVANSFGDASASAPFFGSRGTPRLTK
jgi:Flp pilus assembly protein TadG